MATAVQDVSLEQIISHAIVLSWRELFASHDSEAVHVEYHRLHPDGPIEYLKVLAREGKGEWNVVCQYWVTQNEHSAGTARGLTFGPGYRGENFAHLLKAILENGQTFSDRQEQSRDGLIQISAPTESEREAATAALQSALTERGIANAEVTE